ncbi:uncharacterized protein PITG_05256 [Phytophthora infestans T30-4]|uniref:Uncharacterized protein n=1 Tax=Phytophthora infestans (strain T30-4) TaxID=403677 RepID=D0N3X3_PHYIT|nr:uncharacterized protein PITG_05256 [Phytophthora infestans T30-4]EEY69077.1 hypothetical protein PITG_05256 [Phytophthora infestans T30-4]|eukprot:XP_002998931.1 hypothetical protein PITG_05256 [Phytophthora infestans T30-4]
MHQWDLKPGIPHLDRPTREIPYPHAITSQSSNLMWLYTVSQSTESLAQSTSVYITTKTFNHGKISVAIQEQSDQFKPKIKWLRTRRFVENASADKQCGIVEVIQGSAPEHLHRAYQQTVTAAAIEKHGSLFLAFEILKLWLVFVTFQRIAERFRASKSGRDLVVQRE